MNGTQSIQSFFDAKNGIVGTHQLNEEGITRYQLNQLLQSGLILKVKQGVYKWNNSDRSELIEVSRIVPEGILCLYTACQYYELTTFVASAYHVAIPKKSKVVLPSYPPIRLYYWAAKSYETGRTKVDSEGAPVAIYDLEKTVCDSIRHRNKVGLDLAKEVVTTYLQRTDRNLAKLLAYADMLGLKGSVSNYLDLLV